MWSLTARDEASLAQVSDAVHDAHIDGSLEHDRAAGVVTLPFLQEGWPDGPPAEQHPLRETWRVREYRVTFFRGRLIVRRVRAVLDARGWMYGPTIDGVGFDAAASEVRVLSPGGVRLAVDALDVEVQVSSDPGGHVRRRVGKLTGAESDRWLEGPRGFSR